MIKGIAQITLLVSDYDEAIAFYCEKIGFSLVEDTPLEDKRWVRLRAPGNLGSELLLYKAAAPSQQDHVGDQTGGPVLLFLHTDNFDHDFETLKSAGVEFSEGPFDRDYGKVAVFKDLYGNRIDLIEPR